MAQQLRKALVIDDEEALREIITEVLDLLEIEAVTAKDGYEAIEIVRNEQNNLGLIILDLYMPKLSGKETYDQLKELLPDCPVVFMSGYDSKNIDQELELEGKRAFLKKPFTIQDLKSSIESFL